MPLRDLEESARNGRLIEDFRVELIDGDVVVHAAPGMLHGFGLAGLSSDLHQAYQRRKGGPGGWWILNEVDVELAPARHAYRPDIVGWRQERVQRIPAERPVTIIPDFVCEVLSPTNAAWPETVRRRRINPIDRAIEPEKGSHKRSIALGAAGEWLSLRRIGDKQRGQLPDSHFGHGGTLAHRLLPVAGQSLTVGRCARTGAEMGARTLQRTLIDV